MSPRSRGREWSGRRKPTPRVPITQSTSFIDCIEGMHTVPSGFAELFA